MQTDLNQMLDGLKSAVDPDAARRFVEAFKLDAIAAADLPAALAGLVTALESVSHIAGKLGLQRFADLASTFAAGFSAASAVPKAGANGSRAPPTFSAAKFPLLSSFLAARPNDLATRVDGIRLLILSSALHGGGTSAEKIVADGLRKTNRFPADWGVLVRSLPAPADSGWLLQLPAAIQRAGRTVKTRKKFADRAHLEFLTSLLALARIVRPDLVRDVSVFEREVEAADDGELQDEAPDKPGDMPGEPSSLPVRALWIPKQRDSGFAEQRALIEAESGSAEAPESKATAAASVRAQLFRLTMLDQRLRWAWEHLNPFDLRLLRGHVLEGLEKCEPAALLCALMLATGQSSDDVLKFRLGSAGGRGFGIDPEDGSWSRPTPRPLNAWSAPALGHPALEPTLDDLTFPLPTALLPPLRSAASGRRNAGTVAELLDCDGSAIALLSRWLDPLRQSQPNSRLTHGRISAAIQVELRAVLGDDAAVFLIASRPDDIAPTSLYYTSYPVAALQAAYAEALERVVGAPARAMQDSGFVGSHLTLTDQALTEFVGSLKSELTAAAGGSNRYAQHNRYVAYTVWTLFLATGHRPALDPFEALELFDAQCEFVAISDKLSFQGRHGRIVPLARIVLEHLELYVDHLKRLQAWCEASGRQQLASRIALSLVGRVGAGFPLFFLLDEQTGSERRLAKGELTELAGPFRDLNPNFPRHRFSQLAARAGLQREAVAEALGHIDNGEAALGPRSPLSPDVLGTIKSAVDTDLRALGFTPIPSPLPELVPVKSKQSGIPGRPIRLGTALRRNSAERKESEARHRARDALRRHLRKDGGPPEQATIDAIFAEIGRGRGRSQTLSTIIAHNHVSGVLRQLKYRKGWAITVPASARLLEEKPSQFDTNSFSEARLARSLESAFVELLTARAQLSRARTASQETAAAETIVSMVLHSRIVDIDVIAQFVDAPAFDLLDCGSIGISLQTGVANRSGQAEPRRYRLHPLTAILALRCVQDQPSDGKASSCRRAFLQILERTGTSVGSAPGFALSTSARTAATWLTNVARPLVRLGLPGNIAAFLEGTHRPVGLSRRDWVHVLTGRELIEVETGGEGEPGNSEASAGDFTTAPLKPVLASRSEGLARKEGLAFHRGVVEILDQATGPRGGGKDSIAAKVKHLREAAPSLPDAAQLPAQWLEHLATHGSFEGSLAASSCARYYFALAPRLIEVLPDTPLSKLDAEALTMAYASFMESVPADGQHYVFGRLQEFHRFLMVQHAAPAIEWSEAAPLSCVKSVNVDAGFIAWPDYEATLELLSSDPSADIRERVMQATAWLFIYRFGARSGEPLGLRRKDFIWEGQQVILLFRDNDYREVKSDAGVRQVPLIGPLSETERRLLTAWVEHVDEYADSDWLAPLFGQPADSRQLVDTDAVVRRIGESLRAVTGSPGVRPHHGRHSFGTRLEWLMSLDESALATLPPDVVTRVLGPCRPAEARRLLLDSATPGKRAFWASALAIGHASPDMTLRVYSHLTDVLAANALGRLFDRAPVSIPRAAWSYVSGGEALPKRRKAARGRPITLSDRVVRETSGQPESISRRTRPRSSPKPLSRRRRDPLNLTPEMVDRALEFAHRRGRVDTLPQRLMLPPDVVSRLFVEEYRVRVESGYGVPDTQWAPTERDAGVRHSRASVRTASESRRVLAFLKTLPPLLRSQQFLEDTAKACKAWASRYRHDSTPLVVGSAQEVIDVVAWMLEAGLPSEHIEIRSPTDGWGFERLEDALATAGIKLEPVRYAGVLAFARSSHAGAGRRRAAITLRENKVGPLTSANQIHRCFHVLTTWLKLFALSRVI